jgi:hypothetical protein
VGKGLIAMIVKELAKNILYIENAFPDAQKFINNVEEFDKVSETYSVIPKWQDWHDGIPYQDKDGVWQTSLHNYSTGKQKPFNWNRSGEWPVKEVELTEAHTLVKSTVDLINDQYLKVLDIWYDKTGNKKLDYVSKNYLLRKYDVGGAIGPHIDKNTELARNTMDWSALFYLSDGYEGGEITFLEQKISIKPAAGSALIFPCVAPHEAKIVISGTKYYIFMTIHSEFGHTVSIGENYSPYNLKIIEDRGDLTHPAYISMLESGGSPTKKLL